MTRNQTSARPTSRRAIFMSASCLASSRLSPIFITIGAPLTVVRESSQQISNTATCINGMYGTGLRNHGIIGIFWRGGLSLNSECKSHEFRRTIWYQFIQYTGRLIPIFAPLIIGLMVTSLSVSHNPGMFCMLQLIEYPLQDFYT